MSAQATHKRLISLLMTDHRTAWIILLSLLYGGTLLFIPYWIGRTLDAIFKQLPNILILRSIVWVLSLYILSALFQWLVASLSSQIASRLTYRLRSDAFKQLSLFSLRVIDQHPHGDYITKLTHDLEQLNEGVQQVLLQAIPGFVLLVGSWIMMLRISPWIAVTVVVVMPLCLVVTHAINHRSHRFYQAQANLVSTIQNFVGERIDRHALIRHIDATDQICDEFDHLNDHLYKVGQKAQFFSSLTNPSTRFVNHIAYMLVGVVSCFLGIRALMSIGQIAAVLNYIMQFSKPLNEWSSMAAQFQNASVSLMRIIELIQSPVEDARSDCRGLVIQAGHIEFQDVCFAYVDDQPLIMHLTLDIPQGSKVAIVGKTGAGKTTLVNLLMNFYDLDHGEIRIDGQPLQMCNRASIRDAFGMVLQEAWIFEGTVFENIIFGRPDATMEEVVQICQMVGLHEAIMRLSKAYQTVLHPQASGLSYGEQQLLCIARLMLTEPKMLILDEATSNIDALSESQIQRAFDHLMQNRTTFVIAHRLKTIRNADLILVMDQGSVIEQGDHASLMAQHGLYEALYKQAVDAEVSVES